MKVKTVLKSKTIITLVLTAIAITLQMLGVYELPDVIYGAMVASGLLLDFREFVKKESSEKKITRKERRRLEKEELDKKKDTK